MQTENRNIYKKPREIAGYSQERAAELLDISVESLRAYETGRRVPPGEVVVRMMDLYNCQYLAVSHLRSSEACASFLPDVKLQDLPTAILRLQKELNDFLKCREEVLDLSLINLGLKSYEICDTDGNTVGVIRFNPSDPGMVSRWKEVQEFINGFDEKEYNAPEKIGEADRAIKEKFNYAFGTDVSSVLFQNVSSLALCEDGRMVLERCPGNRERNQQDRPEDSRGTRRYKAGG